MQCLLRGVTTGTSLTTWVTISGMSNNWDTTKFQSSRDSRDHVIQILNFAYMTSRLLHLQLVFAARHRESLSRWCFILHIDALLSNNPIRKISPIWLRSREKSIDIQFSGTSELRSVENHGFDSGVLWLWRHAYWHRGK